MIATINPIATMTRTARQGLTVGDRIPTLPVSKLRTTSRLARLARPYCVRLVERTSAKHDRHHVAERVAVLAAPPAAVSVAIENR